MKSKRGENSVAGPLPCGVAAPKSALQQRCEIICEALGFPAVGGSDAYPHFVRRLQKVLSPERAVFVLYQLFLGRIPARNEIVGFVRHLEYDTPEQICNQFCNSAEFQTGPQSHVLLQVIPPSALVIDVSHTRTYPLNSGIQRVVRSTASQLRREGMEHVLVWLDPELNAFRLLDDSAAGLIYEWENQKNYPPASEKPTVAAAPPGAKSRSRIKRWLRSIAGERISESVRSFFRARRQRRRMKISGLVEETAAPSDRFTVFLWNNQILFPEVMLEPGRLEAVCSLVTNASLSSCLLLHDLIPLHHPDYFAGNVDGFIRYVTLLRFVDRVSCTTNAMERDLQQLLPLLGRNKAPLHTARHYLGSDFDFAECSGAETAAHDIPMLLSVGTFEIRKNQRRVLRGMIAAQQQGCVFKGLFVGHPGWLNETFLDEVAFFQARGFQVEVRQSVSEAELGRLYRQAYFTLYCSLAEGFGLPIVESVAKGVPCITSNRGSMREIAEKMGGCRLVEPESETDIARAITELLQDREALRRLRAEAGQAKWPTWREYAHRLYDFATLVKSPSHLFMPDAA